MLARLVLRFALFLISTSAIVFVPAGTLAWPAGWLFIVAISLAAASVTFDVLPRTPGLRQERAQAGKLAPRWDRVLVPLMSALPFLTVIVASLGKRLGWRAPFPTWLVVAAFVAMLLGAALTYWSMRCNRFFSSHVRVQKERGHVVIDTGPYALIRHPGYAGTILFTVATPLLLTSVPGLAIAAMTTMLIVLRTSLEDRTLMRELAGYDEYTGRVRFRLVPLIW